MTPSTSHPIPRAGPESLGLSHLDRIGEALRSEIAAGKLSGAVVAIARRGKLGYLEAFGHLDRAGEVPMPVDAVFSIASMTSPW